MKRIHVVAGILRDAAGRVLLAQRGSGKHLEGLWEFPGGKVERDESPLAALRRELREEIGVEVDAIEPLIAVPWTYPGKRVELDVYDVTAWRGEPHGREGQAVAWCAPVDMGSYEMPAADRPVVTALALPRTMLVTRGEIPDAGAFVARIVRALARDAESTAAAPHGRAAPGRIIQLRLPGADDEVLAAIALRLRDALSPAVNPLVVNGRAGLAGRLGIGLHLSARDAARHTARPIARAHLFGISAHDADELDRALALDADYVVIGPVRATASHPGAPVLGWNGFETLARVAPLPSFAIGGLAPADIAEACAHGAFGVAGIRAFGGG